MSGPLTGVRVIELAGIGPGPFCAMMLADQGADVLRIDRPGPGARGRGAKYDVLGRGRRSLALDLKQPEAVELVLDLVEKAEVLLEGFRPGVTERLGLGPETCLERNPRLVYGRMTGWGQEGTIAHSAGHDINYIALSGALHPIGRAGEGPVPPLNLVGDFGGGAMMLAYGVLCALLEARGSGRGQVVDAAMTDGSALLMALIYGMHASGVWSANRGENLLDGAAPFYDTYRCSDGKWIAVGSIEPQFYALLLEKTGLDSDQEMREHQMDRERWPAMKQRLAEVFASRSRDEWCQAMEGSDVCFAPVLDFEEALRHPHNVARQTFVDIAGAPQPAPAPRFSRTPGSVRRPPPTAGEGGREALADWGLDPDRLDVLEGGSR